jgi:hypothetical protein
MREIMILDAIELNFSKSIIHEKVVYNGKI